MHTGRYLQWEKTVPSVNICFLLCQDINALMCLGTEHWKNRRAICVWWVQALRWGWGMYRVRDLCPVFVCFSEFSVRVQPESAPNTAAGEGNLLPGSLSSPVPQKSLIPDSVIKLYIGYNIHCCLGMYVLHAVWTMVYESRSKADQTVERAISK